MEVPQPALGLPRWSSSESQGHRAAVVCGEEPVGTARGSAVTPRVLWETTAGEEGQPPASKAPLVFLGRIDCGGAGHVGDLWEAGRRRRPGRGWARLWAADFGGRVSRTG